MSQDNDETIDSTNDAVQDPVTDPDVIPENTVADTDEQGDGVDELKEKLQKQQEQNQRLFERAKKAEGFEKQPDGSWVKVQKKVKAENQPTEAESATDLMDTIAFINAKVTNKEDVEVVRDYARFKKIGLAEALESPVVKATLADNLEKRNTASATNTGRSRSTTNSQSAEALFAKARKTGELPESDADLDRMMEARYKPKSQN